MLKFLAILGAFLATLVAVFMVAVNFGFLEPEAEPIVKTQDQMSQIATNEDKSTDEQQNSTDTEQQKTKENSAEKPSVAANGYKDGIYKTQAPIFDVTTGWKPVVSVEIKDGKIFNVVWDEVYKDGGSTKKELSEKGEYMMTENSTPWHKQAMEAMDFIMEIENPDEIANVDAISSVTIDATPFLDLVKLCVAAAKVQ